MAALFTGNIMKITSKLEEWVKVGLISGEQSCLITTYEAEKSHPKLMMFLMLLGVFCIGLGFVSVIAANWQEIPNFIKIIFDGLLLATLAVGIIRNKEKNLNFRSEGFILAYALAIMGSIGLAAQIFQLQTVDLSGFLLWAIISSPLLLLTTKIAFPIVWFPVFVVSLYDRLSNIPWFRILTDRIETAFPNSLLTSYMIVAAFMYFILSRWFAKTNPLRMAVKFWTIVVFVLAVVLCDFFSSLKGNLFYYSESFTLEKINLSITAVIIILSLLLAWIGCRIFKNFLPGSLVVFMTLMCLIQIFIPKNETWGILWGASLTFGSLGLVMAYAHCEKMIKILNLASAAAGIRIFLIYIQVVGSLVITGIGLVVSGLILLVMIKLWSKFKILVPVQQGVKSHE